MSISSSPYTPVPIAINVGVSRKDGLTSFAAGTNLFNAFVGVGILALPSTFQKGGLYASLILLFAAAIVVNYCVHCILHCETAIKKTHPKTGVLSFTEIGTIAYGRAGTVMAAAALIASQIGFCTAYISFITHNLNDLVDTITRVEWHLILAPLFIFVCQVRDLKYFAPLSFSGNFIYLFTFSTIIYSGFKSSCCPGKDQVKWIDIGGLPAVFGTVCFALQGIALVLPLKNKMIHSSRFPRVFIIALFLITVVCAIFATLGFLFYGNNINDIITTNLQSGGLASAVKIALCCCLISSYATQMFPAAELIDDLLGYPSEKGITQQEEYRQLPDGDGEGEQHTSQQQTPDQQHHGQEPPSPTQTQHAWQHSGSDHALLASAGDHDDDTTSQDEYLPATPRPVHGPVRTNIVKIIVRLLLVVFTLALSAAIANFGVVVTIVGGVANSSMSMLLPALFYLRLCRPHSIMTQGEWLRFAFFPCGAILIGVTAAVCALEYSIRALV